MTTRKRNRLTKFLCMLRRKNLLCRKTMVNYANRIKIQSTVRPDKEYSFNEIGENMIQVLNIKVNK